MIFFVIAVGFLGAALAMAWGMDREMRAHLDEYKYWLDRTDPEKAKE